MQSSDIQPAVDASPAGRFSILSAIPALPLCLSIAALVPIGLFVSVSLRRLSYPFDLEWMEGAMIDHVARVLSGQPLYAEPSFEWTPFIYNPLFIWLGAGLSAIFGADYSTLRLISLLANVASFVLLGLLVHRETHSRAAGLLAAGLFAATFEISAGWLDIGRVDALSIALCLGTIYAARHARGTLQLVLAGALVCLSFLAKQYVVAMAPALALGVLLREGLRPALVFSASATLCIALSVGLLQLGTDGWYWFYAFEVPAAHVNNDLSPLRFFRGEMGSLAPLLFALTLAWLAWILPQRKPTLHRIREAHAEIFFAAIVVSLLGMAWLSRKHTGSAPNCLAIGHAAMALAAGLLAGRFLDPRKERTEGRRRAALAVGVLAVAQIGLLFYLPGGWIPTARDRQAGDRFVEWLRQRPGDELIAYQSHLHVLGGSPLVANQMALLDVMKMKRDPRGVKKKLRAEAEAIFASKRYSMVILNNRDYVFDAELRRHYRPASEVRLPFEDPHEFKTKITWKTRPTFVFLPRDD